eukprot:jgi/Chrpa1/9757/Chrysochromulina_OHIO_Genome00004143-RA
MMQDWQAEAAFKPLADMLHGSSSLHDALRRVFGAWKYRGPLSRAEMTIDRRSDWHIDKVHGEFLPFMNVFRGRPSSANANGDLHFKYLPDGKPYRIVTVALYLQDHSNDTRALTFRPGGHVGCTQGGEVAAEEHAGGRSLCTPQSARAGKLMHPPGMRTATLHPAKGDIVIFDTRLPHRGQDKSLQSRRLYAGQQHRILASLTYGAADNAFSDAYDRAFRRASSVLIVGASRGLGLELVLDYLRRPQALQTRVHATVRKLADKSRLAMLGATPHMLDVTDAAQRARFVSDLANDLASGGLDVLIHSAGVRGSNASLVRTTNLDAPFALLDLLVPLLRPCIVTSDIRYGVKSNQSLRSNYARAKAAANSMVRARAKSLFDTDGILLAAIHPGSVRTDMNKKGLVEASKAATGVRMACEGMRELPIGILTPDGKHLPWEAHRPNASPRPPLSNLRCMPSLEPCLISCIDVDGLGRRIEAAFSCIAAAHSLKPQGVRYVHIRLFELQHGNAGEIVEEWFGLYAVLPLLQRAYAEAGAHSALRRTAEASSTPWNVEATASRMRPIRVKLHIRTVKRRMSACFSGDAYLAILGAVRKRHQVYLAMLDEQHGLLSNSTRPRERSSTAAQQLDSHVSRRRLEFELHCDGHDHGSFINKEPICPSSTCNIQRALRAMQNMSDVRVVWQEGGSRSNRKRNVSDTSALVAVHQLLQADLLVISESSFSIVPSMLGNMTTLAPKCMSRALPHWHRLPCGHSRSVGGGLKATEVALLQRDIEKVVGSLAWPPHRPL